VTASITHETTRVPFLDLAPQHAPLRGDLLSEIAELLDTGMFTNGPQVAELERAFAAFCGTDDCVGVASGLDALRLALLAAGVGRGDEVIVPAVTFIATLEAVSQVQATPVVADITPLDYTLDPGAAETAVTERTRVVLPVHLYGQMADVRRLGDLAERRELLVLEDACQAHGATRDGIRAGAAGFAGAFSFYPGKNLGAMGDAGALTTDDRELAEVVRALREHGQRAKYRHERPGYTARLDTLQAIVILRKLQHLKRWTEERRTLAARYSEALVGLGDLVLPATAAGSEPVWHLYVVRTAQPDALAGFLGQRGIGTGRHYPEPVHLTDAYASLGYAAGAFPVAEALCREALSLPFFPGLTETQLGAVVTAVTEYFARGH
jgi:dTDP-3-amino-3,4,6-trideoxy-alpha-D-glucose transaminase